MDTAEILSVKIAIEGSILFFNVDGNSVNLEFTVFPWYRENGTAEESLKILLSIRPGKRQLKYSTLNVRGMRFWQKVLLTYDPREKELEGRERLVNFSAN